MLQGLNIIKPIDIASKPLYRAKSLTIIKE